VTVDENLFEWTPGEGTFECPYSTSSSACPTPVSPLTIANPNQSVE
jgi:hypothetical protein